MPSIPLVNVKAQYEALIPQVLERIREVLEGYLSYHTRRRPLILPIITEI